MATVVITEVGDAPVVRDERGIVNAPGALLADVSGARNVGTGSDWFPLVFDEGVFIDKSLLVCDVLRGNQVKLYCRPRRFGKTLAATMLQDFFECEPCADPRARARFERLGIWEADGGDWRRHQGAYPVVALSLKGADADSWEAMRAQLAELVARECARHAYLLESPKLNAYSRPRLERLMRAEAPDAELQDGLRLLTELLNGFHGVPCIVIIDEYDAPIVHAFDHGFYEKAVGFMRPWLSNVLKTNPALYRGVLTGVQRISKESIFSGLNNIGVNTALNQDADERFGLTGAEVAALASYLGKGEKLDEVKAWYDGYRFGNADIYNPWSVLSYFARGCVAQAYWTNTSGNTALAHALAGDAVVADRLLALLEPGATAVQTIDPNIAYGELGRTPGAVWSALYMAGYLTTDDTQRSDEPSELRSLRVPNAEVRSLFRREVVGRAQALIGETVRLRPLHTALVDGDTEAFMRELGAIAAGSASMYDLTAESQCHMLLMGLLFGVPGYGDPVSNREAGYGRFDLGLVPVPAASRAVPGQAVSRQVPTGQTLPVITIEVKHMGARDYRALGEKAPERLLALAGEAVRQIEERSYDRVSSLAPLVPGTRRIDVGTPRLRWSVAFGGKHVAAVCERG